MEEALALALSLLYALLCLVFALIGWRPALLRRWRIKLPALWFAPNRMARFEDAWRDLAVSAGALSAMAFGLEAYAAALGLLMLALIGLAALSVNDDIRKQKPH